MKIELVVDKSFPHGVICLQCGKTAKVGDFVAWKRVATGENKFVPLFHKECLQAILAEMPFESSPRLTDIMTQMHTALVEMKGITNDRCSA